MKNDMETTTETMRIPPQNLEAEQALLGAILLNSIFFMLFSLS